MYTKEKIRKRSETRRNESTDNNNTIVGAQKNQCGQNHDWGADIQENQWGRIQHDGRVSFVQGIAMEVRMDHTLGQLSKLYCQNSWKHQLVAEFEDSTANCYRRQARRNDLSFVFNIMLEL